MRTFTPADDGSSVSLAVGASIEVQLPENATTGYRWEAGPFDAAVVEVFPAAGAYAAAIGSGGTAAFQIRAMGTGRTRVPFEKRRAWEASAAAGERYELEIVVGEADQSPKG